MKITCFDALKDTAEDNKSRGYFKHRQKKTFASASNSFDYIQCVQGMHFTGISTIEQVRYKTLLLQGKSRLSAFKIIYDLLVYQYNFR